MTACGTFRNCAISGLSSATVTQADIDNSIIARAPRMSCQVERPSDLPDGQITRAFFKSSCPAPAAKNIPLRRLLETPLVFPPSLPDKRGVSRSSGTLGKGCDGRLWCERRTRPKRTAKSCGSGAPMLASSLRRHPASDGGKKARSPGRARRKPLKPFACGNAG
jgi:hypothetical protein